MSTRTLYLCEKPSQAKTLAKLLCASQFADGAHHSADMNVIVTYCFGHMLSLSMPDEYVGNGKWVLDDLPILPERWVWTVEQKSSAQFDAIGRWLKKADHVVIASDPDDEGEVLAREVLHAHQFKGKISRLWASALNPDALNTALQNLLPLSATDGYYRAGRVRRMLDWLYGMNLSRGFSIKFGRTVHIGRVKTCLLSELVKRDSEIEAFKPTSFHKVLAPLENGWLEHVGHGGGLLGNEEQMDLVALSGTTGMCVFDETDSETVAPPLPYTLSALLADAADLGVCLSNGYHATQSLYELGIVSYPRTGSTAMPRHGKTGFAVHSAIVTTGELPPYASPDMAVIFNLISQNMQANDAGAATVHHRVRRFEFGRHMFQLDEQWAEPEDAGFLRLFANGDQPPALARCGALLNGHSSVPAKKGGPARLGDVRIEARNTVAPAHYDEASLLRMMAKNGIGTEATRIEAINSLARDKVADLSTPKDEYGLDLRAPIVIKPTKWGKWLHAALPGQVIGPDMVNHVSAATDAARRGDVNIDRHLLNATMWLVKVIR